MIHKRRFDIRECEGCLKIKACFLLDPPYQPLVKDIASKYNPDSGKTELKGGLA